MSKIKYNSQFVSVIHEPMLMPKKIGEKKLKSSRPNARDMSAICMKAVDLCNNMYEIFLVPNLIWYNIIICNSSSS